jgi:heme/copper-type cytochrome/quinol oxidase subunit 2
MINNINRINKKTVFNLIITILLVIFSSVTAMAQQMNTTGEDPTDFMRSNGKLFVVVAVILVIIAGLFIYLISLDKKISKLEKLENKNK